MPKLMLALLFAAMAAFSTTPAMAKQDTIDPARRAEVEQIIHDYLIAHPEVIPEAIQVLRERQTGSAIAQHANVLFHDPDTPVAGNPKGDVTIVEFFDYACGYCKIMLPHLQKALAADGNIRLVLKDFPILSDASVTAAKVALAARLQGKYVPFHMALMGARGRLTDDLIYQTARDVGLDVAKLKTDMNRPDIAQAIQQNRQLASALGVSGTPGLVIGNNVVSGALSYGDLMARVKKIRAAEAKD